MPPALPYGPILTRTLRPLQRAFLVLNGAVVAPAVRAGLGRLLVNPLTGHIMVLRTRGRRSGLVREAPLGYVVREGAVWCVAGYGETTPWFRNLVADPDVEVLLPDRRLRGIAEVVTDDDAWLRGYRALVGSFALVGRLVVGDVARLSDAELLAHHRGLPVVRIRPADGSALEPGPFDPGGRGWIVATLAWVAVAALLVGAVRRTGEADRPR